MFHTGRRDLGIGYATGLGPQGINHRLYDLDADPYETTNLANSVEHEEILANMKSKMLSTFFDTHPHADECPQNLTTDGKLVWFCEPRDVGAEQSLGDLPMRVFD